MAKRTVLVRGFTPDLREIYRRALSGAGYEVTLDPEEEADLVLADPAAGIEAHRQMLELERPVCILVLAASVTPEQSTYLLDHCIQTWMHPMALDLLLGQVARRLRQYRCPQCGFYFDLPPGCARFLPKKTSVVHCPACRHAGPKSSFVNQSYVGGQHGQ